MRRFVIGTAGHVDHGKTTLVRALTGVDTDRLPEEKRRGITIELGFARWAIPAGAGEGEPLEASVVDVPGHRRLVHTMIAGASGIELVLLVVAADEGVMPQTREHLAALRLLGLDRAVVAITKVDRVARDLAELAGEEVRDLCAGAIDVRDVVLVSAKTGEGLPALGSAVSRALRSLPARSASGPARLWVDRVFSVRGAGTVVTGTLVEGTLSVGAPVRLLAPAHGGRAARVAEAHVRGLHVHDRASDAASAPTRLAVNLSAGSPEEIPRGALLTTDPWPTFAPVVDVELRAVEGARALRTGASVALHAGTAQTSARFRWLSREEGLARLRLETALPLRGGDRYVLRGSERTGTSGAVRGGGRVLDARPPLERRAQRAHLAVLRAQTSEETARALLAEVGAAGLPDGSLGGRLAVDEASLRPALDALASAGEATRIKGFGFVHAEAASSLASRARALVASFHAAAPLERGISAATLRARLAEGGVPPKVVEEALRLASSKAFAPPAPPVVTDGDVIRLATFSTEAGDQARTADKVHAALEAAGLAGLTERAAADAVALSPKDLRTTLARLSREGRAKSVTDLWFAASTLEALRTRVEAHLAAHGGLTIAAFKAMGDVGRRQAIPLLEHFDREGVTRRSGDDRLPGPRARL